MAETAEIQLEPVAVCPSCGREGKALYDRLHDQTFGTAGQWRIARCAACSMMWLDPRPTVADIDKVYRTYYTHALAAEGAAFRTHTNGLSAARRLLRPLLAASRRVRDAVLAVRLGYASLGRGPFDAALAYTLGALPGIGRSAALEVLGLAAHERGALLDIGCGNGAFLAKMKDLGWRCTGIETDGVAATFAREQFDLDVRQVPLADAGFADGEFDVVTLSHVIEHVHTPINLLSECRRVLRPGGKLVVLTPNSRSLGHRIFGRAWRGLEPPRHLHLFAPRTLDAYSKRAGLETISLTTEARMMRSIWYASRLIQRADRKRPRRNNIVDYLLAYAMQPLEAVACRIFRHVGEEVMLVAVRPAKDRRDAATDNLRTL